MLFDKVVFFIPPIGSGYEAYMDNKRIVFIKLIKNCKPNASLISSLAWAGLIIISRRMPHN